MNKLVISLDGVVVREATISKEKTTLGRRPYNDIVIDNLAVSGEHAMFHLLGSEVYIEDLKSTNGTYVNGAAIKRHRLSHDEVIEVGKYKIKFLGEGHVQPSRDDDDDRAGRRRQGSLQEVLRYHVQLQLRSNGQVRQHLVHRVHGAER
jgi:pSer/pThr/pTyr-binding forkhead associated (FHA) protein